MILYKPSQVWTFEITKLLNVANRVHCVGADQVPTVNDQKANYFLL